MWRILVVAVLLAGCTTASPVLQDMDAHDFQGAPRQAVIYVVRDAPDADARPTVVTLNADSEGITYPGAFVRWVVAPGRHRIAGYSADAGAIEVVAEPGGVYFIRQSVSRRHDLLQSAFRAVDEADGRLAVTRSTRVHAS